MLGARTAIRVSPPLKHGFDARLNANVDSWAGLGLGLGLGWGWAGVGLRRAGLTENQRPVSGKFISEYC